MSITEIRENNILFLLGAGCSRDAGIIISNEMVDEIEKYVNGLEEWNQYKDLYNYLKSSILYAEGIFGRFHESFNVEKLLIVINEIEKRDRNIVYPFIGTWNIRLTDLAGSDFTNLTALKCLITERLKSWVKLTDYRTADYYQGFTRFQAKLGKHIRVFSLNYDLCFERSIGKDNIELGFDPKTNEWHYTNFDNVVKAFSLYKLHGSINWYLKDKELNQLFLSDDPVDEPELIFGIDAKLKSVDPYLYYTYEFRRFSLDTDCKLIIAIGYSFSDDHINGIVSQALKARKSRKLIVVIPYSENTHTTIKSKILNSLKLSLEYDSQISCVNASASNFLLDTLSLQFCSDNMTTTSDEPF